MTSIFDIISIFKNKKLELKKRNTIYVKILSGSYKDSIFSASNISIEYLSVQCFDISRNIRLSFKYDEIEFVSATSQQIIYNPLVDNKQKCIDILNNKICIGDIVLFTDTYLKNKNSLEFGEVIDMSKTGKISIRSIPTEDNKKSIIYRLKYKKNFLKLSDEQKNKLLFNKLKS